MANTLTISISNLDKQFLEENKDISPTNLFRQAITLERHRAEFFDVHAIFDYLLALRDRQEKITHLQKEIVRRNERIESLQDVLAQKEYAERRIRKSIQEDHGFVAALATIENPDLGK